MTIFIVNRYFPLLCQKLTLKRVFVFPVTYIQKSQFLKMYSQLEKTLKVIIVYIRTGKYLIIY